MNPADAHGCPACPHPVQGPGTSGSPDVFVNNKAQMRIGDPGMHMACCGPNSWNVAEGSKTVFVNGIPPSRTGDATSHCGGTGKVIQGSPNVIIGDATTPPSPPYVEPPPPKPRVVEAWPKDAKFFVNLPDNEGKKEGRKVTVKARVEPPQGGVPVTFKLLDVAGNATEGIEAGAEAKMLTQTAVTDGSGVATADMQLSQVAGDQIQARATTEDQGEESVADTGLQAVWRKLKFDVTRMEKPASEQGGFFSRTKRYSLEDDLAFAIEGFKKVYIDLEDTGTRYSGEYVDTLRAGEEVEAWCNRACSPGPPGGDAPTIHLVVVNNLHLVVVNNLAMADLHGPVVRAGRVDLTHQGGGLYAGEVREPPYVTSDGQLIRLSSNHPWADNPSAPVGTSGYPNSFDDGATNLAEPFPILPDGPLGTTRIKVNLSGLPERLKDGGAFPSTVHLNGLEYLGIGSLAGYCSGGGQYVVVGEQYDGEVLMHEIGHALGLCNASIDQNNGYNHCALPSCTMFYADDPSSSSDFHGGPNPAKDTCAHWLRRLNMTKEHLYERWWTKGGWPEHGTAADADGCPCGPGMFYTDPPGAAP
jgi:uncharacterized Zn-binding protein involved in type VI secretion